MKRSMGMILPSCTLMIHRHHHPILQIIKPCHAYNNLIPYSRHLHFERLRCNTHNTPLALALALGTSRNNTPNSNRRRLLEFYRGNFHDRPNKKVVPSLPKNIVGGPSSCVDGDDCDDDDAMYVLRNTKRDEIVAALRLTRSKNNAQYSFLRSLCVSRHHRRNGVASILLDKSIRDFNDVHHDHAHDHAHAHAHAHEQFYDQCCYCFASPQLETLYEKSGFERIITKKESNTMETTTTTTTTTPLPKWLIASYNSMADRWNAKDLGRLCLFVRNDTSIVSSITNNNDNNNNDNTTQIILLQHSSESSKKTATGWLLDDTLYHERFPSSTADSDYDDDDGNLRRLNLKLHRWTWAGRNDVSKIKTKLERLVENSKSVHLLWTDSAGGNDDSSITNSNNDNNSHQSHPIMPEAYIILDGTWQQSKQIYRRTPCLWTLPRVSLRDVPQSKFRLRGNYGWKEKFQTDNNSNGDDVDGGGGGSADNLLCTAEVAAAVMDRCGESESGDAIRKRLDVFQDAVLPRRKKKSDD